MGGDRTAKALMRLRRRHRADEALARGADQQRQAERLQFAEPGQRHHALLRRLAEADAGIEHDIAGRNAGLRGDVERPREEGGDILHDVDAGIGAVAVVHDDHGHAARRDQRRHAGIALQPPDVVGDGSALIERPGDDRRFHAVDRDGNAQRDDLRQHRLQPLQFVVRGDRLGAVGPGRFRADVDDVGALGDHPAGLSQRALGGDELSAVGE